MTLLSVDFETRGTVELKRSGVYPYAKHHDTYIWCMAYAFDDEDPLLWRAADSFPERIIEHVLAREALRAWNANFERVMWRDALPRQVPGIVVPDLEQWYCTMADACAMALPRALEHAAEVLHLTEQKDMSGNRLSKQMSRPRRFDSETDRPIWWEDEGRLEKLYVYCLQDVRVERAAYKKTNRMSSRERQIYLMDQRINDRGVALDRPLIVAAQTIAEREIAKQNAKLAEATSGRVTKITKVAKLKAWIAEQGIEAPTLAKKALEELLNDDTIELSPPVRAALEAREEAAKSSVAKLDAMLDCIGRDDRARGLLLYSAASTLRWGGRLIQPHNFPRGEDMGPDPLYYIDQTIRQVLAGDPGDQVTMKDLSNILRGCFVAGPGRALTASDFAAIEARVLAWLAHETVMLEQFEQRRPIYKEMAGVIYNREPGTIVKPSAEYQLGKNTVLGCGYGMGWDKFMTTTGVEEALARSAVNAYRLTYSAIPEFWDRINAAAISAVNNPGKRYRVGYLSFGKPRGGGYLLIGLPSGSTLFYAGPRVVDRPMPWDPADLRPAVEYSGVNSYNRKWERMCLYGGLLAENVVSCTSRDLLADAMLRVEAAGYANVLSVHDELVVEHTDPAEGEKIIEIMKEVPDWATGCPVDAEGWTGPRYRK